MEIDAGFQRELEIPLFEIKDIPGKGKGLVARSDIPIGTRILCEEPLLIIQPKPNEELELLLAAKLKAMPNVSQRQFLSLHNNFPGSCIPNAHNSWNKIKEHETIHAIRPIRSGEEITISYDHGGPLNVRQGFLKQSFGFTCSCNGCTLAPSALQASDSQRTRIQMLDEAIGDPFRINPRESLKDCYSLLQILELEFDKYAGALFARLYYDAFQICIAHKDRARASIFAERAYQIRVICEGEDSPDTLRMKSLSSKPADHSIFGAYSNRWQTSIDSIPKGLDELQFNRWLFRQGS